MGQDRSVKLISLKSLVKQNTVKWYISTLNGPKRCRVFLQDIDPKRLITAFELYAGIKITSEDTLIVLDEIQAAAQDLTSLKYFYEASCKHNVIFYISTTNLIMYHCIGKFLYFMYHCIGTCTGRKKCL
jgi:hypothetical protein